MATKKTLAVFGATGYQGGAIISHFRTLHTSPYHIRALTRNPSSAAAQKIASSGIEVIRGDLDDAESLTLALAGVSAVFLVTDFFSCADPGAEREKAQAKRVLDILSSSPTLEHLIFSSLPSVRDASGGKYTNVVHFDGKAEVVGWLERTHKDLWAKTTVLWVGTYMQLWKQFRDVFAPAKTVVGGKEVWVHRTTFEAGTKLPLTDVRDVGKTARAILETGAGLMGGKTVSLVAAEKVSVGEQLDIWGRFVGRETSFQRLSDGEGLEKAKGLGFPEFLEKDIWEVGLAFRDCEGRLLEQEGVVMASEILPESERLTNWREFVEDEDWKEFLEG
ncbi:hypothetical protein N0V90_007583 [Kalmusia sp. IMI 367209]|nr:hypothetical protein N0V90_007583 [Kalmusia sp. IMI 367209]